MNLGYGWWGLIPSAIVAAPLLRRRRRRLRAHREDVNTEL
jgi:hypothetical protein